VIRDKSGEFIGQIVAGGGEQAGDSELAYLIRKDCWNQGYGTEAAVAVVKGLLPILKVYGFQVEADGLSKTLTNIEATARSDNPASGKILETVGLSIASEEERHGALRQVYKKEVPLPDAANTFEILTFAGGTQFRESTSVPPKDN
jgi:RimJ/RimL family protein N-acetyltransferase